MKLGYWARHPLRLLEWLRYALFEISHPGAPWISAGAIRFLDQHLSRDMRCLEFGSGRSTLWIAARVGHLTSVEHNPDWYARVDRDLRRHAATNCELWLVPLDHPERDREREQYDPVPRYVSVLKEFPAESLDVVLIDGHYRTTCLKHCGGKLRRGGFLVVDDLGYWPNRRPPVPDGYHLVHESISGRDALKATGVWKRE
jgi:predicted O-methyltransferase YrrM